MELQSHYSKPVKALTATVLFTVIVIGWLGWNTYATQQTTDVQNRRNIRIEELRGIIVHLDEVLTMSARMAATTGDLQWEIRYQQYEPELDAAINEAIALAPQSYQGQAASETDAANMQLVQMENRAFDLVRQGQLDKAWELLFSKVYIEQKRVYALGMENFSNQLKSIYESEIAQEKSRTLVLLSVNSAAILALAIGWFLVLRLVRRWQREVQHARQQLEVANSQLELRVEERTEKLAIALAEAEEATRAKSEFLANMSHEIRTPMNAIIGFSDLLLATGLAPEQRDFTATISSSAHSLLGLINDILNFAKIEAGKVELEVADFDLYDELEAIGDLFRDKVAASGVEFAISIDDKVARNIAGDALRLRQVLVNLASNAFKFTTAGEIVLGVADQGSTAEQHRLLFSLRDTGIGIDPAKTDMIFSAFTQAETSTTRKYGGTGLGLAISKQLVQLMGGEIWVESGLGEGSTFYFTANFFPAHKTALKPSCAPGDLRDLKVLVVDDKQTSLTIARPTVLAQADRAGLILVVEDHAINQKLARTLLEQAGYTVDIANNGLEAVAAVHDTAYAAVLMDIQMPVLDGLEATGKIRRDPRFAKLPIIAMTANAMQDDREICLGAGMDDYVCKPIDGQALLAVLNRWIPQAESATPVASLNGVGELLAGLQGIEVETALQRVGGDEEMLLELLGDFAEQFQTVAAEIRAALAAGDGDRARHLVHTLKGVAGNLSAREVETTAQGLETALKEGHGSEIDELVAAIDQVLQPLLHSVRSLSGGRPGEAPTATAVAADPARLAELIAALTTSIDDCDPVVAAECLAAIKSQQIEPELAQAIGHLEEQTGNYDFDEARQTLRQVAAGVRL